MSAQNAYHLDSDTLNLSQANLSTIPAPGTLGRQISRAEPVVEAV